MVRNGYLIRSERGPQIVKEYGGNNTYVDVTHPGARRYLWEAAKRSYWDAGVRVFWLDEAEPEYLAYEFDFYRFFLGPDLQIGNVYPAMFAKAFFDGMSEVGPDAGPEPGPLRLGGEPALWRARLVGRYRHHLDVIPPTASSRSQHGTGRHPVVDVRHRWVPWRDGHRPGIPGARHPLVPIRHVLSRPAHAWRSGTPRRTPWNGRRRRDRERWAKRALVVR